MSIENPVVTVVIPIYNREAWVLDAIQSVVNNTYQNKKIVLVDDGSSDDSVNKVLSVISNVVDIKVSGEEPKFIKKGNISGISCLFAGFHRNYGPSMARNYAIKTAWENTDLFAFLDSDDWYEPSKIEKSVNIWKRFPGQIGVIYSDYTTVNSYKNITERQYKEPYSKIRLMQECIINNDSLISKLAFEKCGLYDETLRVCEDYNLWLTLMFRGFTAVHIPESLVNIRVGEHSSTSTIAKEEWNKSYNIVMQKLQQRLNNG